MSVLVNGPDGANTLFIATGLMLCAHFEQTANTGDTPALEDTFEVILDEPRLAPGQFRRSIASASLAAISNLDLNPSSLRVEHVRHLGGF
jgi:hypothetical protein